MRIMWMAMGGDKGVFIVGTGDLVKLEDARLILG